MKIYKLKSVARRGSLLAAAFVVASAAFIPAASTFADALNPLTERSLALSSASPGWSYLDASGNPTYAPPNSGANGKQTGNTFSFRVSSSKDVKGLSFQYCVNAAGSCVGPGNILNHTANNDAAFTAKTSDLEIKTSDPTSVDADYFTDKFDAATGQPKADLTWTGVNVADTPAGRTAKAHPNLPARDNSEGNFIVLHKRNLNDAWTPSYNWAMAAEEKQDLNSTNKANYITLANEDTPLALQANDYVKVIFFATDTNYITNPGDKSFFVKINTFNTSDPAAFNTTETSTTIIDGGVTVANVMNRSIEIQTKVLETMDFSVGTVDPVTLDSTDPDGAGTGVSQLQTATGDTRHKPCAPIVQGMGGSSTLPPNVLQLGSEPGEFSLQTDTTFSTHSYWRLSSNSSGGATVYYSGVTLSNTVGDQVKAIGKVATQPSRGQEQFGLALDTDQTALNKVSYAKERDANKVFQNGADNAVTGISPTFATDLATANYDESAYHTPQLAPLSPKANYAKGSGVVNATEYGPSTTSEFAFDPESSVIPTPLADGTEVLDCVTGKMRYIANIAATTPAGVYTTKINYVAAPQY